jgi:hypothetical protein
MKSLQQLVDIVSPNKLKGIELLPPKNSYHTALYQNIAHGQLPIVDTESNEFLIGDAKISLSRFKRVKRELSERLINLLFLIDSTRPKYKDLKSAYFNCHKNTSAVKILLSKGARLTAIQLAEKTLIKAKTYEFTDISLSLSTELMVHYGSIVGDKKKFYHYKSFVDKLTEVYKAEIKAESYYAELGLGITISRASKQEFKNLSIKYTNELDELIKKHESYRLNLLTYNLLAFRYELSTDYEKVITTCERALYHFNSKKYSAPRSALFTFYFRQIPSHILLGSLEEAKQISKKCLKLTNEGYSNWYKVLELRFIIFLHSEEIDRAFFAYTTAVSNKNFQKQYPDTREAWYIYEAYIYYFYLRKAIKGPLNERLKKFRLNKFLNEVPTYSKDKRGMNISILILQILFLLHQEKYGQIIDRTEALRTYTHRYLRRDETFRSNCFIKMLMQLPKANFHKAAVIRKTKDLREKLSSVSIRHNQSAEVEAVPYEVLWDFVLGSLKHKIY